MTGLRNRWIERSKRLGNQIGLPSGESDYWGGTLQCWAVHVAFKREERPGGVCLAILIEEITLA